MKGFRPTCDPIQYDLSGLCHRSAAASRASDDLHGIANLQQVACPTPVTERVQPPRASHIQRTSFPSLFLTNL